ALAEPSAVEYCTVTVPVLPLVRVTLSPSVPAPSDPLTVVVLSCRVPGLATVPDAQAENSEVLPSGSVAVAVNNPPTTAAVGTVKLKAPIPAASVVRLTDPR